MSETRHLIGLGNGVYSVSSVCRILGPKMTPRRVHYWLDTGLITGVPVARGARGHPTLLSFQQLLEIKTVQYLRDQLFVSLPKVRDAYAWILRHLFADEGGEAIEFSRGQNGDVVITRANGESMVVPGGQLVFNEAEMNNSLDATREAWAARRLPINSSVVADPRILVGAPTVMHTRIETAIIASFADDGYYTEDTIDEILSSYPQLTRTAVVDALTFEGIKDGAKLSA